MLTLGLVGGIASGKSVVANCFRDLGAVVLDADRAGHAVLREPDVISALKAYRPTVGTAPQEFVQRASVVAWEDEEHVDRTRDVYRRKRDLLVPVLERKGYRIAGGAATMYLWVGLPDGVASEALARRLLEHGLVVSPGTFFGPSGDGYVRIALVPTEEECRRAAEILDEAL